VTNKKGPNGVSHAEYGVDIMLNKQQTRKVTPHHMKQRNEE